QALADLFLVELALLFLVAVLEETLGAGHELGLRQLAVLVRVERVEQGLGQAVAHAETAWAEGRRRQLVDRRDQMLFFELAALLRVGLAEKGLSGRGELVQRHPAVLVGAGPLDERRRQRRP